MEEKEKLAYLKGLQDMLDYTLSLGYGKGGESKFRESLFSWFFQKSKGEVAVPAASVKQEE